MFGETKANQNKTQANLFLSQINQTKKPSKSSAKKFLKKPNNTILTPPIRIRSRTKGITQS